MADRHLSRGEQVSIHRDLKPANIMLTRSGVKLMDFGLAKAAVEAVEGNDAGLLLSTAKTLTGGSPISPLTTAGAVVGTIQYMSPEQIEGKPADVRSDIFALGAVLYECATGKRPFDGKSQISIASAILEKVRTTAERPVSSTDRTAGMDSPRSRYLETAPARRVPARVQARGFAAARSGR